LKKLLQVDGAGVCRGKGYPGEEPQPPENLAARKSSTNRISSGQSMSKADHNKPHQIRLRFSKPLTQHHPHQAKQITKKQISYSPNQT